MSEDKVIDGTASEIPFRESPAPEGTQARQLPRRTLVVGALALPLAFGAVGLSLARNGTVASTPVEPVTIQALVPSGATAIKGQVAEIYGNKFVVQDATGRALVETGPAGEGGKLVAKGEDITAQGRFADGFLHARLLTHADGRREAVGPAGGPPFGSLDWAKDRVGLGPAPDVPALSAAVRAAGYDDVRVTGRGPRHLEVAAKDRDGQERELRVDFDGHVRPRPAR